MFFFRLIRFPNLLIIALTQFLVRYFIVKPFYGSLGLQFSIFEWQFALIVLSTILIAAAGYIINDCFDVEIDSINKPNEVIIGKNISATTCKILFFVLSAIGISIGAYFSFAINLRPYFMVNFLTAGLLWFYAISYKRMFLAGNVVVSALCALSIFVVAFSDRDLQYALNLKVHFQYPSKEYYLQLIILIIAAYSAFAFLISLIREIIKDMEDMQGDKYANSKTMPIVAGVGISKLVVQFLIWLVVLLLVFIQVNQHQWENVWSFVYVVAAVQLPLIALSILLYKANRKEQFAFCSSLTKMVMLTGILSMVVFNYTS